MLREEFEKQVRFKVTDTIYMIANNLYMRDFNSNSEFCKELDKLVYYIEQEKDIHLQSTVEDFLYPASDSDDYYEFNKFMYALLGEKTVIYLKCKNNLRLTAYELSVIENELNVSVYETKKKRESKAV